MQTVNTGAHVVPENYRAVDVCDCCCLTVLGTVFLTVQSMIGPLFMCDECFSSQGGKI